MDTQITTRDFDASPALKQYVVKRLEKLERFYDGITNARVVLTRNGEPVDDKSAEITVNVYRQTLTANDKSSTFEKAVDNSVDRLRRQVLKYKEKLRSKDKDYMR